MTKKPYVLLADKKGYGLAGEPVTLTDKQAEFLLLSGAIAPVREDATPPVPASVETGTDEQPGSRARRVKPG